MGILIVWAWDHCKQPNQFTLDATDKGNVFLLREQMLYSLHVSWCPYGVRKLERENVWVGAIYNWMKLEGVNMLKTEVIRSASNLRL